MFIVLCSNQAFLSLPPPPPTVLHDNKLTHTDLKPENILFVNSDFTMTYNVEKVGGGRDKIIFLKLEKRFPRLLQAGLYKVAY